MELGTITDKKFTTSYTKQTQQKDVFNWHFQFLDQTPKRKKTQNSRISTKHIVLHAFNVIICKKR